MNKMTDRFTKGLRLLVIAVLLAVALGIPPVAQAAPATRAGSVLDEGQDPTELLQFTAAGHVLGFQAQGMYVVGSDHMVKVEFADTAGVAPLAGEQPSRDGLAPALSRVTYPHLWEGITLIYERVADGIARSSYLVEPGADVGQIKLRYNAPLELDAWGNLVTRLQTGQMTETAPLAWQEINGQWVAVEVAFRIAPSPLSLVGRGAGACTEPCRSGEGLVGFAVGEYDPSQALMIDPSMVWNTFLGGESWDSGNAIAVDGSGNVYLGGTSGATWGSPVRGYTTSTSDAFAAKLDAGGALQWHTFLGGTSWDSGNAIAVDGSGNVYLGGSSNATWGSPINPYQGYDAFTAKLNASGELQWNTFLGGTNADSGEAIAVDGSGNVYVGGLSWVAWGTPVRGFQGGGADAFAAKLDAGGALQWHTFLGGTGYDYGKAIAVDGSGNVYVGGYGNATWGAGECTNCPIRPYQGGNNDVFAAKLNASGALQWNTFLGGTDAEEGTAIAIDGSGNVYVGGTSWVSWGSPVRVHQGVNDAFAAKLNASGALQWNTFLGGTSWDYCKAIAVDGSGNVYAGGYSGAAWGSPVRDYKGGQSDAFAAKLNASGALQWNGFLGGTGDDYGIAIAVDGIENVYVGGNSTATWGGGECPGCPVRDYTTSDNDAFAAKISRDFDLTVNKAGSGTGTVTSSPAGIHCGADCAGEFSGYTTVTLAAYPGVKSYFVGWGGDCDANGQVTMDADKTCTVTFGYPVGGIVVPVDKLGLVAPWMGLAALAAVVGVLLLQARRRK